MMGVYIKGMKMPSSCFQCEFRTKIDPDNLMCIILQKTFEDRFYHIEHRDESCPLVPVPKHGRLGDLEQAVIILERLRDHCGNEDMAFALNWAANKIRDLPTIIPADPVKEVEG